MSGRIVYILDHIIIMYNPCFPAVFDVKFSVPARFLMKGFRSDHFLNHTFHVGVK